MVKTKKVSKKESKKELSKKIKNIEKEIVEKTKSKKYIKIPLIGFVLLIVLLVATTACTLFSLIKLKDLKASTTLTSENVFDAEKTDKPELDFYVMSFCPYGNMIEDTLRPVFDLLGDQIVLRPRYIFEKVEGSLAEFCNQSSPNPDNCETYVKNSNGQLKSVADCKSQIAGMVKECNDQNKYLKIGNNLYTSLHGRIEANQDVRELCAYKLADDKKLWWDFVANVNKNCTSQNADTCWEEQAKEAGLDTNKITECFNKDAASIIEEEIVATTKNNITGSPTVFIGDKAFPPQTKPTSTDKNIKIGKNVYTMAQTRTSNVIKEALCTAFKKAPKACQTKIEEEKAADTNSAAAAAAGGGCGK